MPALLSALAPAILQELALQVSRAGRSLPVLATAALAAAGGTAVKLVAVITFLLFTSGRPLAAILAADE